MCVWVFCKYDKSEDLKNREETYQGTIVSLRPGIWHHAPFAYNSEYVNVMIVLPERTYANDCTVYEIPEERRIEIEQR